MDNTESTPSDRDLARRIVRAAGFTDDQLTDAARQQFERVQEAAAKEPTDPEAPVLTPQELWMVNSGRQLQRFFGGRCITCSLWTPPVSDGGGTCPIVAAVPKSGVAILTAGFGCTAWAEIAADGQATLTARTELAMAIGLLEPYPGD